VDLIRFESVQELRPVYEGAAAVILPFLGGEWLCNSIADAAVCGRPVVGPDLQPVRDYLSLAGVTAGTAADRDGPAAVGAPGGAVFSPNDFTSVTTAIDAVLGMAEADGPQVRPRISPYSMSSVAARLEGLYRDTIAAATGDRVAGRTPAAARSLHVRGIGTESPRRWAREAALDPIRPDWINADLHMHTTYSRDSKNTVETIIRTAREIGLGAIAVTDHNEIKGALRAKELADGDPFVIVAEEIKSREGEVIGLFLQEWIPPKLSFDETLSRIKEQGALVYVPHPFDALRTTPSYQALVDNLHRIDVIEIYNAKVALSAFNLSAERFAARYNIVAGAGSDAHVRQALGTAMLRMPRFHDPESFMAALWEADIIARRKNLLYLQSLKLLQTTLDRVLPED